MTWTRRSFLGLVNQAVVVAIAGWGARADEGGRHELVMVEEAGCRFCRKWDGDIGPIYPQSPEGKFAPLKRVKRGASELAVFGPVVFTPTFILVRENKELGRITGYPGESYFWEELAPILVEAGFKGEQTNKKT